MRRVLRGLALIAAAALLVYGMLQDDEKRWMMCLWGSAPLLALAFWPSLNRPPQGFRRGVQNLGFVLGLLFVLLSVQLLRLQFVDAGDIYSKMVIDETTGEVTSNVRPVRKAMRVLRGQMVDRRGMVLAGSERVEGGFSRRTYPIAEQYNLEAFSDILGFASTRFGLSGLEESYNDYLIGEKGDAIEKIKGDIFHRDGQGNNLHLTIDARLQAAVYDLINSRGGGVPGSVVVIDPQTGAILALASNPGFDPNGLTFNPGADDWEAENQRINSYWEQIRNDERRPLLNRAVQGLYAPGSVFKAITAAAVIKHPGVGKPNQIDCPDERMTENGAPPVHNAVREDLARFTGNPSDLKRVFAFSCNTAFAEYGMRLGPELLADVSELFHIYRPEEAPDQSPDLEDLYAAPSLLYVNKGFLDSKAALADTAFGQGQLLISPFQMAMVAAAVGNEGEMMQAYLVDHVTDPQGEEIYRHDPDPTSRVMTPQEAAQMKEIMRAVVDEGYVGAKQAQVQGLTVGGKSGTAETGVAGQFHAWFIAIAPLDNPRYAVCVMLENGGEGTGVGAALTGDVLRAAVALEKQP